ncbi:small acid-soluble spore protein K [Calidifontibacillus erzurumensis]|uniref:Small, acid-soluble spore protein K n=1 Tax=Calidifontibacillus erzurumensis TaxID=2741433 RepID=A0A8J8KC00_9BACI|nr:small acid-soluble spore protein K [Calidifontibacillus erzurumensis]NSL52132.1 small, acid-soluble spore protein K [Calidifontibacillus erzurumensis]
MVRNKETNFPARKSFNGEGRAKPEYSSLRANGQINTHPQERMRMSNERRPSK